MSDMWHVSLTETSLYHDNSQSLLIHINLLSEAEKGQLYTAE